MTYLARAYSHLGRPKDAVALYREILDAQTRTLGPEHPSTLWTMNNLGVTYDNQGRYKDAEVLDRKTLEIRARVLGPEHPDTLSSMFNLSQVLEHLVRYEEAGTLGRKTLEIRRRVLGPEHPKTLLSTYYLGDLAALEGDRQQAFRYLREAVEHGYSDANVMLDDPDLKSLKGDPELERIVAAARANGERAARAP
jgi:tetratricopeptide (TPR) repeat protein